LNILKAIFLGLLQGLTEFLPISSSGHLVIAEHILNFKEGGLAFEVFVHFGTLISVLWVFRKEILKMIVNIPNMFRIFSSEIIQEDRQYAIMNYYIIIASLPAAIVGILFEDKIEMLFESYFLVFCMLFITGIIMWSSKYTRESHEKITGLHALLIGIAQAFAIIPGISRSGSTIVTGLWLGVRKSMAAQFSFILSIPVIFGATLLKALDLIEKPPSSDIFINLILATLAAAVAGYFAIIWLLDIIKKQRLQWFGVYCLALSLLGLFFYV
jgi:undecaprenyl-diphosphatase